MKFTTLSFLSSLATLSSLASAFVYPATPVGDTVWKPNTNVTISWTDDKQAPLLASKPVFDIFLMTGADDKQVKLATIAKNVKGGTTNSIKYLVPAVSPPGQIYFLMFVTKDNKGTAWATRFTITDEKGNPGTLRPRIPAGGKINPGGVGVLVHKGGKTPANAPAVAPPAAAAPPAPIAHGASPLSAKGRLAEDKSSESSSSSDEEEENPMDVSVGISAHKKSGATSTSAALSVVSAAALGLVMLISL